MRTPNSKLNNSNPEMIRRSPELQGALAVSRLRQNIVNTGAQVFAGNISIRRAEQGKYQQTMYDQTMATAARRAEIITPPAPKADTHEFALPVSATNEIDPELTIATPPTDVEDVNSGQLSADDARESLKRIQNDQ